MGHFAPFPYLVGMDVAGGMAERELAAFLGDAARGDDAAFANIVRACHEDMRRVCLYVTRDQRLAEDAVQDAWSIAWRKLGDVRDPSRLRAWLMRVAINEAKKALRARAQRSVTEIRVDETAGPSGANPETGVRSMDLRVALARLSADDRALLALRYVAGFNASELAEIIGITPSGTRNRLERLLARLRQELGA